MKFSIFLTEEAEKDAALTIDWYNEQKAGLGKSFLNFLNEAIDKIISYPTAYKKIYKQVRQAGLKKFPYVILYTIDGGLIKVTEFSIPNRIQRKKLNA